MELMFGLRAAVVVAAAGCGRLGFDANVVVDDDAAIGGSDAPVLPASHVCASTRITIPPVAANADLAVYWNGSALIVLWESTPSITMMKVDATLEVEGSLELAIGPIDGIAGVVEDVDSLTFVVSTPTGHELWHGQTPSTITRVRTETRIVAREPLLADAAFPQRAWVRGDATGLLFSFVSSSGSVGPNQPFLTNNPVTAIAGANNDNHTHLTWTEAIGIGGSQCVQADLDLLPPAPIIGGTASIANDCLEPRIDSGPGSADAIFTAYRTSTRTIGTRYRGSVADATGMLSMSGRAPKVRFDGTQFWVAWIEEGLVETLRIASVNEDLVFTATDLPGWTVVGDEAFEIVRAGPVTYLVLLSTDSLSFLRTCAP